MTAAEKSRAFERKDTRDEAAKALAVLQGKGMQFSQLAPAETAKLRTKLAPVNESIAGNVGQELWNEAQAELAKMRK
jgi:TRAP-type C4-dicarboxylate transport system substrate-binding protein